MIEAAYERAIAAVPAWRTRPRSFASGRRVYQVHLVQGLVAARFRHYEARSCMTLFFCPSNRGARPWLRSCVPPMGRTQAIGLALVPVHRLLSLISPGEKLNGQPVSPS
ncbi:hypothetical protein ACWY4P_00170 [Streptomyces sp. LZ34]